MQFNIIRPGPRARPSTSLAWPDRFFSFDMWAGHARLAKYIHYFPSAIATSQFSCRRAVIIHYAQQLKL